MKILHIVPIYFTENQVKEFQTLGGGERYPFELARFLALNNPKDEVQIMIFGNSNQSYKKEGIIINIVKSINTFPKSNKNFTPLPISIKYLEKIYWADAVHGYHLNSDINLLTGIILKFLKKPFFLTDLGGGCNVRISRIVNVQPFVDYALCISRFDQKSWKIKNKKIIYGGVDINKYPYKKNKEKYILYVGRILPHKGVDILIKAMPENLKLIIAGRTYNSEYLAYLKHIAKNKIITIIENPEDKQIITLYQNASCFVLPSTHKDYKGNIYKKTELFGLVVVEAMACGTPAIVSDAGPLPELVKDGYNGFIFKDGDRIQLKNKIVQLSKNSSLITKMGQRSRKLAEKKYNWTVIAKHVREIYEKSW